MTLNDVMAVILRYFTEFGSSGGNYVEGVEVRRYCLRQKCSSKNLLFFGIYPYLSKYISVVE